MNILVTGGLGLIGHNVVRRLQDQGHIVSIMDIQTNYGIIPQSEIDYLIEERIKKINLSGYYKYDICDSYAVNKVFNIEQPEIVIHMASFPRQKVVNANPAAGSRVMSEGLLNLLEASRDYDTRKFVYISSSMVYGDFVDDVTEDQECRPQGQYGIMKLAGEWLVRDYSRRDNIVHTIIRPSAVYGPLDVEDRVIAKFMLAAMRGGILNVNGANETLDFTYVDDAADGIVAAALSLNTDNKTYNITKSHSRTLLEAAQLALKLAGGGTLLVKDKDADFPSRGALNIDAARRDFGFDPKVDVEQGFEKYYEWLKNSLYWAPKTV
ncbi:NAD(P)-dependent oxidoreductase [Haliscomenobacter sp.]|uniref:NAD-dependent epimerase/dehydratase family protein n=1 Tax=Haliscomenobacter sp. TaxID=2717303 RepID=UPI003364DD53